MSYYDVTNETIDNAAGAAVINLREAFVSTKRVFDGLARIPTKDGVDALVSDYGFTEDEAYLRRLVFETIEAKRKELEPIMEIAKALTAFS